MCGFIRILLLNLSYCCSVDQVNVFLVTVYRFSYFIPLVSISDWAILQHLAIFYKYLLGGEDVCAF